MKHPIRRWTFGGEKLANMRDLGGYACQGGITRYGTVLRSEQPCGLSDEEKSHLVTKGLTDVIDLRSDEECAEFPNSFAGHSAVTLHRFNLKSDLGVIGTSEDESMGALYEQTLDTRGAMLTDILATVAASPGLVLIHCLAGKDRTGIVVALLLLSLGVAGQDVIADYQVSEVHLTVKNEHFLALFPEFPRYKLSSDAGNMKRMLGYLEQRYGGSAAYLKTQGFPEESLERLKRKMIEVEP